MIEQVPFAEIEADPDFAPLVLEYGAERGLPPPRIRADLYHQLDEGGQLHVFAARAADRRLIGFAFLMVHVNTHGLWLACLDCIYVVKAHRFGRAGLRLLRATMDKAKELGVPRFTVTAPCGSPLARLLPKLGFDKTNELFTMTTSDADVRGPALPAIMSDVVRIRPMTEHSIERVKALRAAAFDGQPEVPVPTLHTIHGGVYTRLVFMPAGTVLHGTQLNKATTLFVQGHAEIFTGAAENLVLRGFNPVLGSVGRAQSIKAISDVHLAMVMSTDGLTLDEVEREMTDEFELLASRRQPEFNHTVITGE